MAFMNVEANINRKKGKKAIPLWKPKQQAVDSESSLTNYHLIQSLEKATGKNWVDCIYQANGLKRKEVIPID